MCKFVTVQGDTCQMTSTNKEEHTVSKGYEIRGLVFGQKFESQWGNFDIYAWLNVTPMEFNKYNTD